MKKTFRVLLLNGPNLNLLGQRDPVQYGSSTLSQVVHELHELACSLGVDLVHFQSNAEHRLIDTVHSLHRDVDFIVINPAAFTHTSLALKESLVSVGVPFIEVHISNIFARENFRRFSYFSDAAIGVICGLGTDGYRVALEIATKRLRTGSR